MKYYTFIQNNKINGCGQCKQLTEGVINIEVTEDIYNNISKYIYQDNQIVLNPNYEAEQAQREAERIAQLKLTKREVFLALYNDTGITPELIKAQISDPSALIELEYANEYYRGNPLIDMIGTSLGYTKEQLDYLFEHKNLPPKFDEISNTEV